MRGNKKGLYVFDCETLSNMFMVQFEHYKDNNETYTFVIHELRNDFEGLIDFLETSITLDEYYIGFNNIGFDQQIMEFILKNKLKFRIIKPEEIAENIYAESQAIIESQNFNGGESPSFRNIPEYKLSIKQIDLLLLNGLNNPARRCSLKWLQYSMDWKNMQEMPIHHSSRIETQEEINTVISYCINDVKSTKEFYNRSKSLLEVRQGIKAKYGLECYSYSDTKMGSELLLQLYCDKTGFKKWDIKKSRTIREEIPVSDILFDYLKFQSLDFIGFHEIIKKQIIRNTKDGFKYSLKFKGYTFELGQGGIHQSVRSGIYRSDDDYTIIDADISSMYPSIAVVNGMYPAHLGKEFYGLYKNDIVDIRLAEKAKGKDGDKAIIDGYKQASNSVYGSSNNKYSWLMDPSYTMQTCINGQLLIIMLVEDILLSLPDSILLQSNTDGISVKLKRSDVSKYYEICKKWEDITKLQLEYAEYSAMFIRNVNNYLAIYTNGKTKCKGSFEFENLPLYKNKSFLVVTKAVYNFFVHNTPPEQYLMTNRNIFDYCGGVKANGNWIYAEVEGFGSSNVRIGKTIQKVYTYTSKRDLSKIVRYYVSSNGKKIIKLNTVDGRKSEVEAGTCIQTEFNQYVDKPWEEYNIDESYYLDKIYKEISTISPKETNQLQLEF